MNDLFNEILINQSETLSVWSAIIAMVVSLLFGFAISITYMKTKPEGYQRSFVVTLLMLPVVLAVIILFVGSNVARAFSMAGALTIIRFRSAPGDRRILVTYFSV